MAGGSIPNKYTWLGQMAERIQVEWDKEGTRQLRKNHEPGDQDTTEAPPLPTLIPPSPPSQPVFGDDIIDTEDEEFLQDALDEEASVDERDEEEDRLYESELWTGVGGRKRWEKEAVVLAVRRGKPLKSKEFLDSEDDEWESSEGAEEEDEDEGMVSEEDESEETGEEEEDKLETSGGEDADGSDEKEDAEDGDQVEYDGLVEDGLEDELPVPLQFLGKEETDEEDLDDDDRAGSAESLESDDTPETGGGERSDADETEQELIIYGKEETDEE